MGLHASFIIRYFRRSSDIFRMNQETFSALRSNLNFHLFFERVLITIMLTDTLNREQIIIYRQMKKNNVRQTQFNHIFYYTNKFFVFTYQMKWWICVSITNFPSIGNYTLGFRLVPPKISVIERFLSQQIIRYSHFQREIIGGRCSRRSKDINTYKYAGIIVSNKVI